MKGQFLRGFIDGLLSTLGIVIGASSATNRVILAAAIGGTIANGISNILSAFSATGLESYSELRAVEKAMLSADLSKSEMGRSASARTRASGIADGLGTVAGGGMSIIPYLFLQAPQATIMAAVLAVVLTALVGVYLGKLSRQNVLISALKMGFFAVVVAVVVYFVQTGIAPVPDP